MASKERKLVRRAFADGIRPEPKLTISAWADKHRRLPQKSSAEPGPWRTSRTPYLREIMDALSATSPFLEIVFMAGSQIGKSETILNCLGYIVDHAPGPVMLVQPTVDTAKRFSRQRIGPLFDSTPKLVGKVVDVKTRDARSSMLSKEFMGGVLVITGANSAVGLRSMPARWLLLDEIDAYPVDVDDEGDPISLAEARQRTFARRKTLKASSPTIEGLSAIERAFNTTDQRRYFVPCPHCREMQTLEFPRLTWTKLGLPPDEAVYLCISCEKPIEERHKSEMLAKGEWRATGEGADPKVRGYHLSALYSPVGWLSWGQIAKQFMDVRKDPEKLRVFTNTVLGETWRDRGEAPEWQRLRDRRESYQMGTVPRGGLFLTAGVDVQKDRLVVEIVAWGRGKESWSIDYGILPGDTDDLVKGPWTQLEALLARSFGHEDGTELSIRMLAVDSGFNTSTVYSWARKFPMNRVIAVKGQGGGGALIGAPSPVEINLRGQRPIHGYKVWPVAGAVAKSELYGFLSLERPADDEAWPAGWCHFPEYDDDYFRQLTAEQLVSHKNKRGFITLDWELIPGRENHVLDARVYARAAATLIGLDRFQESDWATLERSVSGTPAAPRPPRTPRDSWLHRGRG
jgi:phage terminase large subunit GpA-like protein